jgi:uncharacterized protein (DUF697 family)
MNEQKEIKSIIVGSGSNREVYVVDDNPDYKNKLNSDVYGQLKEDISTLGIAALMRASGRGDRNEKASEVGWGGSDEPGGKEVVFVRKIEINGNSVFITTGDNKTREIHNRAVQIFYDKYYDKKRNTPLTKDEKIKCNSIIHAASAATGAMGIIPIGPADTLMITPLQIAMIISLGAVFNIRVTENLAKSIIGGVVLSIVGREVAATLLNFIPVGGWVIKGGTAAALTEGIGWTAVAHFHDIKENHSKFAGKKEGYAEASAAYEAKLRRQADEFLKKETVHKSEMAEFSQLIEDLTKMIIELSTDKNADSSEVKERICILEGLIDNLKKMRGEE